MQHRQWFQPVKEFLSVEHKHSQCSPVLLSNSSFTCGAGNPLETTHMWSDDQRELGVALMNNYTDARTVLTFPKLE